MTDADVGKHEWKLVADKVLAPRGYKIIMLYSKIGVGMEM